MVTSLKGIINTYGFDGIDLDIECGSSCWSPNAAVYLANRLKSFYGNDFIVAAAPRPFEVRSSTGIYAQFALQAGNSVDLVTMQDFDFTQASDATQLASIVDSDIAAMVAMGIPDSKIVIGCITYSGYSGGHNSVEVYRDIYLTQKAKHPGLRGVYLWELSFDKADGWGFTPVMVPAVLGG
jgi:chitinase